MLIFHNTRAQAEMTFRDLWNENEASLPIGIHHGSLAPEARHKVEAAMAILLLAHELVGGDIVSGGGTGTWDLNTWCTEIQAGSYVFMDRDYGDNQLGAQDLRFEHALFVRGAVLSRTQSTRAILDAGLKAFSVDSGMPTVWQRPELTYLKASDEHGVLEVPAESPLALGEVLMLVPGHCDPTVNLYDELVCIRGDRVEAIWPIAARGALL